MRLHPATKAARKVLKQAGIDTLEVGTLSLHAIYRGQDYTTRPLIIDIKVSAYEDKAKLDVSWLSDSHPMYAEASKLHGTIFEFA